MAAPPPTLLDLKLSFLTSQIHALNTPLRVPSSYEPRSQSGPEDRQRNALREANIDVAMAKLNQRLRSHNKQVYSRISVRHVAEQVGALYSKDRAKVMVEDEDTNGEGLEIGVDFAKSESISALPDTWDSDPDNTMAELSHDGYTELVTRLKTLDERRAELREKVQRYRALRERLRPFENATENVQGNLLTKGGEVEIEMERMRVLVGRIVGRLGRLKEAGVAEEEDVQMDLDEEGKIMEVVEELMS